MADTAIMEGGTIAVGDTATPNTLTFLSTKFLPAQVANAVAHGLNPTVYASEALGLALAGTTGFNTNFGDLNQTQFLQAVANATGVNPTAISGFLANWIVFYTANPPAGFDDHTSRFRRHLRRRDRRGIAKLNLGQSPNGDIDEYGSEQF